MNNRIKRIFCIFIMLIIVIALSGQVMANNQSSIFDDATGTGGTRDYSTQFDDNGTYFIRNKYNNKYLTHIGSGMAGLSDYTGSDEQKWNIKKFGNDYVITNMTTNTPIWENYIYCLYNFSNYSVSSAIGSLDPTTDIGMRWKIVGTTNSFMLKCVRNQSYMLYSPSTSSIGLTLVLDSSCMWEALECSNPYLLPSILDGSFSTAKFNTSGYDGLLKRMNCYAYAVGFYGDYAVNNFSYSYNSVQPGYISGSTFKMSNYYILTEGEHVLDESKLNECSACIISSLENDLGELFNDSTNIKRVYESSLEEEMVGPWKKVALVIKPDYIIGKENNVLYEIDSADYHWFVECEDGYWTHKLGLENAYVIDFSGVYITNPETCDRGLYTEFIGYYKIKMDAIPEYISYDDYTDSAGDIEENAQNLGVISNGLLYQATSFYFVLDYCSPNYNYTISSPVVNTYQWRGDVDWYEFMVSSTSTYEIYTSGDCPGDLYGTLFLNGVMIASDDDSGVGSNFKITVTLSPGNLYKLRVSGYAEDESAGNYRLNFY